MSAISTRIMSDHALNPTVFANAILMHWDGTWVPADVVSFLNAHIADNQDSENPTGPLTAAEQTDITDMETAHGQQSATARASQMVILSAISEMLREGVVSELEWDNRQGL